MIYLDYAASAPVSAAAMAAAAPFFTECFANPASIHALGRKAALAVMAARGQCAAALGASPEEIFFTSGGTESDNWAVFSAAARDPRRRHVVTSAIEHPAVLSACAELERRGCEITRILPDSEGLISPQDVERALRPDTALCTIMAANNEVGTLQPVDEIAALCNAHGVLFHTDAVQAAGNIPLDLRELRADMLTLSAHKLGGFKGSGLLFIRRGTELPPYIYGGGQQHGMRSGTENVPAVCALGAALEEAARDIPKKAAQTAEVRNALTERLSRIPRAHLNGSRERRLCGNVNFSFEGVEGESLVLNLDIAGVCASSASACAGGTGARSHVLRAMGLDGERLRGSLRLTLSHATTMREALSAAEITAQCVERLRALTEG